MKHKAFLERTQRSFQLPEIPSKRLSSAPPSQYFKRTRNRGSFGWSTFLLVIAVCLVLANAVPARDVAMYSSPVILWFVVALKRREDHRRANARDYQIAQWVAKSFDKTAVPVLPGDQGLVTVTDARVGEVSRHFDKSISASMDGWMEHRLVPSGFGVGVSVGSVGVGLGSVTISGNSEMNLQLSGSVRDQLMADALMVVLEIDKAHPPDVLRVVVPPEHAVRELMAQAVRAAISNFEDGTHTRIEAEAGLASALSSIPCDVSYVADRLSAVLRMELSTRPLVSVVGSPVTNHAVVAGGVQIGDSQAHQLVPLHFISNAIGLLAAARQSSHWRSLC